MTEKNHGTAESCDECGHLPAIGNVIYEDSGRRPLCPKCNPRGVASRTVGENHGTALLDLIAAANDCGFQLELERHAEALIAEHDADRVYAEKAEAEMEFHRLRAEAAEAREAAWRLGMEQAEADVERLTKGDWIAGDDPCHADPQQEINWLRGALAAKYPPTHTDEEWEALGVRAKQAEAVLAEALTKIAAKLELALPPTKLCDPVTAIVLDIGRLLDVQSRWVKACDVAREHCPVDVGRSHIDPGIPRLAKRAREAEGQRDRAHTLLMEAVEALVISEDHGFLEYQRENGNWVQTMDLYERIRKALADEPQTRDFNPLAPINELPPDIQEDIRTERGHVVPVPQGAAKMAMRKLLEFECAKCGKHFEELVEGEHEEVKCPHCGSLESKRVVVTIPAHGKHDSWRVT